MAIINSVRRAYWKLSGATKAGSKTRGHFPVDFDEQEIEIFHRVRPYTMTSKERVVSLIRAVTHIVRHGPQGAIVECGVWKGGSMMAVALALQQRGVVDRDLYLFDTFDGMPPPSEHDRDHDGVSAARLLSSQTKDSQVWARAQLNEVEDNMLSTGYPMSKVHLIRGKVEETIPETAPKAIALLRLDTDWYESTKHELTHLFPLLEPGGVLILDDYGHWQGARKAVDEYVAHHELPLLLCRIDASGRIAIKPNGCQP